MANKQVVFETATTKTPKAELLANYNALRQRVVDVAMEYANDYSWCDQVRDAIKEIGLGHLLPPQYIVQFKRDSRTGWIDWMDDIPNLEDAVQEAEEFVESRANSARHTPAYKFFDQVEIRPNTDLNKVFEKMKKVQEGLKPPAKPPAPPKYPKYRVVKRTDKDEVVWEEGQ